MKVSTIAVLVRRVPDPTRIAVDRRTGKLITADIPYILNPVDLSAIELGLRLKEAHGAQLVALTIDEPTAEFELREALAMGCDRALLLSDPAFEATDTLAQAHLFKAALEKLLRPQIVLAAARSIDHNWSTIGPQLAFALEWPLVIEAEGGEVRGEAFHAVAHTGAHRARVEAALPCVVSVARGVIRPRTPTSWGISRAFDEANVETKSLADLGGDPNLPKLLTPKLRAVRVVQQEIKREQRRIEGEPAEIGRILGRRLMDQGWAGRRP